MAEALRERRHGGSPRPDQPAAPPANTDRARTDVRDRNLRRARQPFWKIARKTGLSLGPGARIAKAKGLSRLFARDQGIAIIRHEKKPPGEMIHLDIKKLGRIEGIGHRITGDRTRQSAPRRRKEGGKALEYLHLAGDDHSRLAYFEILPDETRRSCPTFLLQALRFFRDHRVKVLRGMTGNGVSFRSHRSAKAWRRLKSSISAPDPIRQEQTERPNASCRPPCENGRSRSKIPAGEACWNLGSAEGYAKPITIPPNGPPHACLSAPITIIIGLTSAATEGPLSQGSPSITYRDTTARARP